ncbi:hypothetical protein ACFL2Q_12065 [Thermodesulfobacteriota bacterium]
MSDYKRRCFEIVPIDVKLYVLDDRVLNTDTPCLRVLLLWGESQHPPSSASDQPTGYGNLKEGTMAKKRVLQAKDIIADIRSGMADADLMQKYRLTSKGLQSAFTKLLNNRLVTVEEIYGQHRSLEDDTVIVDDLRLLRRHYLAVAIPIYETAFPDQAGRLRDITERGIGISGIPARLGERKAFLIPAKDISGVESIEFEAECIWADPGTSREKWTAGFQVITITEEALQNLRELMQLLTLD